MMPNLTSTKIKQIQKTCCLHEQNQHEHLVYLPTCTVVDLPCTVQHNQDKITI